MPIIYPGKKNNRSSFTSKKQKKIKVNWLAWLLGGFFILVAAALVWLLFFSPYLKIKEVNISGENQELSSQIREIADSSLGQKKYKFISLNNYFIFSVSKLSSELLDRLPEVGGVEIKKKFPKTIEISFLEQKSAGVFCKAAVENAIQNASSTAKLNISETGQCYFINSEGIAYKFAPEISGTLLTNFYDPNSGEVQLGQKIILPERITFADEARQACREYGIDFSAFILGDKVDTGIKALTEEGWFAYFETTRPARQQAEVLRLLLENELKGKLNTINYIDLRMPNRAYYR